MPHMLLINIYWCSIDIAHLLLSSRNANKQAISCDCCLWHVVRLHV